MKESYIKDFEDYLRYERKYSDNTIESYLEDINIYNMFIKERNININITKEEILSYLKYLDDLKYKKTSISRNLSTLRSLYKYLEIKHIIKDNPFKRIRNPKKDKKLPNFLSYEEVIKIIDSIEENTPLDIRNKLIVELLYATGLRVSELVNIKLDDINYQDKSIKVLGKGSKERITYFGDYAYNALIKYLNNARDILLDGNKSNYLFINSKKNKLSTRGVEEIIDKVVLTSSIKHKISPHVLRHTFATSMLNEGADIRSVQELLGHASLSTTQIYTHVTSEKLREEYLKSFPRK